MDRRESAESVAICLFGLDLLGVLLGLQWGGSRPHSLHNRADAAFLLLNAFNELELHLGPMEVVVRPIDLEIGIACEVVG